MNFLSNEPKSKCYNCPNRKIGCHGTCKDYLEWSRQYQETVKKEKERRLTEYKAFQKMRFAEPGMQRHRR